MHYDEIMIAFTLLFANRVACRLDVMVELLKLINRVIVLQLITMSSLKVLAHVAKQTLLTKI